VKLVSLSDGKFKLEDKHSHLSSMFGSNLEMGPCAVVSHKGLTILLTSQKMPPFDLGQLRSQGLEPQNFSIIVVKAAVGHKQAYDPITGSSYIVDLPGPCSNNLKLFTYHNVKRPIYPLDSLNC
jgi:microcystin degradation protein MlrC